MRKCVGIIGLVVVILQAGCLAPPILFPKYEIYGKVIDQYGDPVPDVKIKASWNCIRLNFWSAPAKEKWISSDKYGRFYFGKRKADDLSVGGFRKEGYELFEDVNYDIYLYKLKSSNKAPYIVRCKLKSSKKDPYIVRLRKIGEPTFLLSQGNEYSGSSFGSRFPIPFKLPFSVVGIDLLQWKKTREIAIGAVKASGDDFHVDLQVMARYAPDSRIFKVTFKMPESEPGGFIYTNKSLFEAPVDGYQKCPVSFILSGADMKTGFFYVKSRNPTLYTKVRWRVSIASKPAEDRAQYSYNNGRGGYYYDKLELYYHAYINPYGERNFEPSEPLLGYKSGKRREREFIDLSDKLRKDARAALAKGELAKKPDLVKLLEEASAKFEVRRKKCQARKKEHDRIIKEARKKAKRKERNRILKKVL